MRVFENFNNVSAQLKPVKLKKGEIAEYQFLIGKPDVKIPDKINYPVSYRIKTYDRVYDPGVNDFVDIGVFEKRTVDMQGNVSIRTRARYLRGGAGLLALTGGIVEEEELYEFLEMSNENLSNPHRDTSVVPMFKRINYKKDAEESIKKLDVLTEALVSARGMNDKEIREFAAAMNWNENEEIELLQNQIGNFAKTKPEEFLRFSADPELKDKSLIKLALTKGIIKHDVSTNRILWGKSDTAIAVLNRVDGVTPVEAFVEWLRLSPKQGENVVSGIKKQLNQKINENLVSKDNKPSEQYSGQ